MNRYLLRLLQTVHFLLAAAGMIWAYHLKDPHLLDSRTRETPALVILALSGSALTWFFLRRRKNLRLFFFVLWFSVLALTGFGEYRFLHQKETVLTADGDNDRRLNRLGAHLVVGYHHVDDIRELVRRGYVGGVFVTRRNVEGKTFEQVRDELSGLQALRRQAGLPPLMIASDQEGGMVSRLSPPLPRQPALASVLVPGLPRAELDARVAEYARQQGSGMAALGVNVNFSPVLDLKPERAKGVLDFHTRIAERAIASDPETVSRVALVYNRALLAKGVLPTAKHFPGLGSVTDDTHHFSAHLTLPLDALNARDWVPFRVALAQTPAMLMVGHVFVDAVDRELPASLSAKLLTGIVREDWKHEGVLVSDDMTMAAVYNRGLCQSSTQALNAGMDLLLVSYDWEKIYPVLACLLNADRSGQLRSLEASRQRLKHLPWISEPERSR
ncbi:beta-N-acetylhexosaminidase [Formivibrio citricus]|uniref:beta-N-acetylhexosaminidase n=1 Tax=Formivibrio citricus TaxID=83765 RepID=A0A1I5AFX7_9NEIS|nr:glycoside hydrolase family 3 N-terminal domain-containing protein [Formivibrio citricus]SFN61353.1 beta-N-acetylhexosaminidase [Formivibrio citricus]